MPSSSPLLSMREIDKRFMGAHALADATLEVEPAEVWGWSARTAPANRR